MGALADLLRRCSFPEPGTAVTCAVSGGPDSLALLALAAAAGLSVTAVHVDHGLRTGSAAEADVVAAAARRFGATFRAERVVVTAGPNLEARARAARHAVLPPGSLLGHTADDQAETMLLNLLRGAGPDGMRGMRAEARRPLLRLRRADTVALCRSLALTPVTDPTNDDRSLRRNRVRHDVVPLLDEVAERDVVAVLARQAALFAELSDFVEAEAKAVEVTDARALAAAPSVLARAAVRRWLRHCSAEAHPPAGATVERVLAVARGDARATDVGGGWRVERHRGRLDLVGPAATDRQR